jgi:hypothetical protein
VNGSAPVFRDALTLPRALHAAPSIRYGAHAGPADDHATAPALR